MLNRLPVAANLILLILFPVAWTAPLARAGVLPFFSGTELTIFGAIGDLWEADVVLAIIVTVFAVIAPYLKVMVSLAIQFGLVGGQSWRAGVQFAGKLSMADIFLIALYIVIVKGVGVGYVDVAWGLYLFSALVLASLAVAFIPQERETS